MIKSILSFLKSKFLWGNILLAGVVAILLVFILIFFLKVYTHHGQAYEVPNFIGMYAVEAESVAKRHELNLEVIDSVFVRGEKPGMIIEQTPKANLKVKKDRVIYVTINSINKPQISLPELLNLSERQATYTLKTLGFQVGDVQIVPSEYADVLLDIKYKGSSVSAGDKLPDGAVLSLVVGRNGDEANGEMSSVPHLIGLTKAEALAQIEASGLIVGFIGYDETEPADSDSPLYKVYKQQPSGGLSIMSGKRIDVWLTKDENKSRKTQSNTNEDDFF